MPQSPLRVLILGAGSGIAQAVARIYAAEGASLLLAGRNEGRLGQIAADLSLRGAGRAETAVLDFLHADVDSSLRRFAETLGGLDHIIICYGTLGNQSRAEAELAEAEEIARVNYTSVASWTLAGARLLKEQGRGSLVVLGSVAGDRGRRSNFVYGAAKAGIATLVQGLSHSLAGTAVRVVVVKPGPTDTAMTAGMKKGGPLWSTPEQVARIVRRAADKGGPIQYAPGRWRLIMGIIRMIPFRVFNKMNF